MVKKRGGKKVISSDKKSSSFFLYLLTLGVIIFVLQAVFVLFPVFHNNIPLHSIFGNLFIVSISSLAFISSVMIYRSISFNFPREKKGKLFLSIAMFLFLLGDLLWLFNEIFLSHLVPIGNIPDFIWIIAHVFLIFTLIYFISISFRPNKNTTFWIILLALFVSGFVLYSDISEDFSEGDFDFAHAVQDSYILFDFIVLFLVIDLIWPILPAGRKYYLNWLLLGIGISIRAVYDKIFADMSQHHTYFTGHPIDLMYTSFYLFVLASFYFKSKSLEVQK